MLSNCSHSRAAKASSSSPLPPFVALLFSVFLVSRPLHQFDGLYTIPPRGRRSPSAPKEAGEKDPTWSLEGRRWPGGQHATLAQRREVTQD